MTMVETNIYDLWGAKQTGRGAAAAAASKKFKQVAGDVGLNPDYGSENYSDGSKYGDSTDWLNSVLGQGTPGLEFQADEGAWWHWAFHGQEVVSTAGTNEVQSLSLSGVPTGGNIVLSHEGNVTTALPHNAAAAAIQTALNALPSIGAGGVAVTGGPWPAAVAVTFSGPRTQKRAHSLPVVAPGGNLLSGGTAPNLVATKTTPGVLAVHKFEPTNGMGFWIALWKKVGMSGQQRQKFNDCRIGQLVAEASQANKAARLTPSVFSLDPGEVFAVDPTPAALSDAAVLLFTDAAGTIEVDNVIHRGASQLQYTLNEDLSNVCGDAVVPWEVGRGRPAVTLGTTVAGDDDAVAKYNRDVYGVAAPTAGTKPKKALPGLGSYEFNMQRVDQWGNTLGGLKLVVPGVRWQPVEAFAPNPDSGVAEIGLTGEMRRTMGLPGYTIEISNQAAAYTV